MDIASPLADTASLPFVTCKRRKRFRSTSGYSGPIEVLMSVSILSIHTGSNIGNSGLVTVQALKSFDCNCVLVPI